MKRVIFWITFPFLGIFMFVAGLVSLIPCAFIGAVLVVYELLSRYEWYMLDADNGYKREHEPLKQVFLEGFNQ